MSNVINTMLLIFWLVLLVVAITPTINRWLNHIACCIVICSVNFDKVRNSPVNHPPLVYGVETAFKIVVGLQTSLPPWC